MVSFLMTYIHTACTEADSDFAGQITRGCWEKNVSGGEAITPVMVIPRCTGGFFCQAEEGKQRTAHSTDTKQ